MKLLFVHGHETLKEDTKGNFYTSGSYNDKVWDLYLKAFDNIEVMFRKDETIYDEDHAKRNFQLFNNPKVTFSEINNYYSSLKSFINLNIRKKTNNNLEERVKNCDYLIARLPSEVSRKAIKFAIKHKKPYLVELVGCPWDAYWFHSIKGKILAPYNWYTTKKSVANSKYVIYVTDEFLQKRYPNSHFNIGCSDVILKSINQEILDNRLKKVKKRFYDQNELFVVGTIAPLNIKYKGQKYVIKAISELKKEGHNIEYQLVGGGDNSNLKKISKKLNVEKNVKFLNSMPHEEVFKYLDKLDLYIQPSLTEGLPRSVIESLSRACPSIGSKVGGIPELVSEKNVFAPKDVKQIKELIKIQKNDYDKIINECTRGYEASKRYEKLILKNKKVDFLLFFKEEGFNG